MTWLNKVLYGKVHFSLGLIVDEDRRYPETVDLFYDAISKRATLSRTRSWRRTMEVF